MSQNNWTCEVCGRGASSVVQDTFRDFFPDLSHGKISAKGDKHYFCDEHHRESETTQRNWIFRNSDGSSVFPWEKSNEQPN